MLTIFTTPKPFFGHIDVIQRNALCSWKALLPDIEIILFGNDQGAAEVSSEFGLRHEAYIEKNHFETKRLDYIFRRAQQIANHDHLCYVNCDILLLSDFARVFARIREKHRRFLMVGRRWDAPITESWTDFPASEKHLHAFAAQFGVQQPSWSVDYFLFTKGLYDRIPPLVIGRVWWDHWLVWYARHQGADVIDASSQVMAIHQNHDYGYHPQGAAGVWNDEQALSNFQNAGGKWHLYTIDDATHILDLASERPNYRRLWAPYWRVARPFVIPAWHKLLAVTRPVRHRFGLSRPAVASSKLTPPHKGTPLS
jgi:hypothetical protein